MRNKTYEREKEAQQVGEAAELWRCDIQHSADPTEESEVGASFRVVQGLIIGCELSLGRRHRHVFAFGWGEALRGLSCDPSTDSEHSL